MKKEVVPRAPHFSEYDERGRHQITSVWGILGSILHDQNVSHDRNKAILRKNTGFPKASCQTRH